MANATRAVGEAASTAVQRVEQTLDQGKEALVEMQTVLAEKTRECVESTDVFVREKPWQAVGIAAGIGLVIGLLVGRR